MLIRDLKYLGLCIFVLSPSVQAQCVNFSLTIGRFNLPIVQANFYEKTRDFVLDLGMSHGMAIEPALFKKLSQGHQPRMQSEMDLTGNRVDVPVLEHQQIHLNGYRFQQVNISQATPWGLVLSAKEPIDMPSNTIGFGLFKQQGIMTYSRTDRVLSWCDQIETPENVHWQPLVVDRDGIHVRIQGQDNYDLVLDSASTHTVIKQTGHGPTCETLGAYQCHRIWLDPAHTRFEEALLIDMPEAFEADGLLGDTFFQHHDVILDTTHNRLGLVSRDISS